MRGVISCRLWEMRCFMRDIIVAHQIRIRSTETQLCYNRHKKHRAQIRVGDTEIHDSSSSTSTQAEHRTTSRQTRTQIKEGDGEEGHLGRLGGTGTGTVPGRPRPSAQRARRPGRRWGGSKQACGAPLGVIRGRNQGGFTTPKARQGTPAARAKGLA